MALQQRDGRYSDLKFIGLWVGNRDYKYVRESCEKLYEEGFISREIYYNRYTKLHDYRYAATKERLEALLNHMMEHDFVGNNGR